MNTIFKESLPGGYIFTPKLVECQFITWGLLTLPEGYEEECMYVKGTGYYWCE